jgi:hypothetical protein
VSGCSSALARSIADGSPRYAASVHLASRVLTKVALHQAKGGAVAPDCYYHLLGVFGLAEEDPQWNSLLNKETCCGTSFITKSVTVAFMGTPNRFASDGFRSSTNTGGVSSLVPQNSPVVRFVSGPADVTGMHSMVPASPTPGFALPPMATITLQSISPPGTWQENGIVVDQTRYTVTVSFA